MYTSELPNDKIVEVETSIDVFFPTYTSELLIRAAHEVIDGTGTLLDLGCGSGIVGISIAQMGLLEPPIYASDVSEEAVSLASKNAKMNNIKIEARRGSLFRPWAGMKFDCIIDDVSGVAEDVARLSPWYSDKISCDAGSDGSKLIAKVLDQSSDYLNENGFLLFPVVSLSDTSKIVEKAKEGFPVLEKVATQTWNLPLEMYSHIDFLKKAKNQGRINFDEKFGMILCWTEIYKAGLEG